ncbi:XdhC family protein [Natronobacterium texcoconense]|uniref:Xanthine dehydrogenase accessory factor n=1 Tax=Natronobacterium texcoconense TaxID=1095778 RepID=A0A1H1IYW0_NATTX|nr:XdhC family protein [Natronobacterium texcoconense]SDR42740.1 xanthine dehydrogenase accessory factor [Natronobacterium texcoconense]
MTASNWSVPETEVVQRVRERVETTETDVLATIVDVEGNAYRRPGAKMLLDEEGGGVGSITAGCLEDELLRQAESVRESGRPELVTYDLMEDDDDVWGLGVGCNGIIDVLLEPLTERYQPAVDAFDAGEDVAIVTVLESDAESLSTGDRLYYYPDGDRFGTPGSEPVAVWPREKLREPAEELADRGRGDVLETTVEGERVDLFVDGLSAPPELVVFGTGHDVGPVVELAKLNDFRVTVVSFRGGVDPEARFPSIDRGMTTSPGTLREDLDLDGNTYAVVMTHNFVDDRLAVDTLLESPVPYVGLMGPRERFEEMLAKFETEGRQIDADERAKLYTPVGLDLGSGSPYGIAHSIVAELLAVVNDCEPRHLTEREGPVHGRVDVASDPDAPTS